MKRLLFVLCGISLLANAGLAWRAWRRADAKPASAAPVVARVPFVSVPVPMLPLGLVEKGDPATIRDQLRQAGADEPTIRAVLDGLLRNRYREKLTAERIGKTRHGWWKTRISPAIDDVKSLRENVTDPLRKLLGPEPLDLIDAENRYAFLLPEKRRKLAQIDQDYREMRAQLQFPVGTPASQTRAEQEQLQLLSNERRKDVLAELTPEEQSELALRFSEVAHGVIARMNNIAATEAEYRVINPMVDEYECRTKLLAGDAESGRADLAREIAQQFVDKFGYDRAVDIVWAGYNEYAAVARASRSTQLPENTVGQVMTLSAETGLQAAAIHRDEVLTPEEKRAAFIALQQSARTRLDALLPPATQQLLEPSTFNWLTELKDGKYRVMSPGVTGYNGYMPVSLNQPPPPPRYMETPLMPVRPHAR
jgi:hypothetical protein